MDEGDRSTDADESADRDERTEDGSATAPDGPSDEVPDETGGRIPDETDGRILDETDGRDLPDRDDDRSEDGASDDEIEAGARGDPESPGTPDGASRLDGDADWGGQSASPESPDSGDDESLFYRFRHDREGALMWIREMLSSVAVVLLVGLLLFGVSGVWPPMVAVESGSMEPNMRVGDLVFVTEPGRLAPDAADNGVGVVTHEVGQEVDYRTFGSYGSVVIYTPPGRTGSPIIHRAMFHVTEGENWYDRADEEYHNAVDCESLANCPAPHDGYITLGDNNGAYDQASGLSPPVRAEWVNGVARVRVPYLGYIRLIATGQVELNEAITRTVGSGFSPVSGTSFGANAAA